MGSSFFDIGNGEFSLTREEILCLATGKFHTVTCPVCAGSKWFYVNGVTGDIERPPTGSTPEQIEEGCYYTHPCDECNQFGFNIVFHEEGETK